MVRTVASNRGQEEEADGAEDKSSQQPAVPGPSEINMKDMGQGSRRGLPQMPPINQGAQNDEEDPQNRKTRCDYVGQNPHVGIAVRSEEINCEQQQEGKQATDEDDQPAQAEPIPEVARQLLPLKPHNAPRGNGRLPTTAPR
jgi:hypothetical protein